MFCPRHRSSDFLGVVWCVRRVMFLFSDLSSCSTNACAHLWCSLTSLEDVYIISSLPHLLGRHLTSDVECKYRLLWKGKGIKWQNNCYQLFSSTPVLLLFLLCRWWPAFSLRTWTFSHSPFPHKTNLDPLHTSHVCAMFWSVWNCSFWWTKFSQYE